MGGVASLSAGAGWCCRVVRGAGALELEVAGAESQGCSPKEATATCRRRAAGAAADAWSPAACCAARVAGAACRSCASSAAAGDDAGVTPGVAPAARGRSSSRARKQKASAMACSALPTCTISSCSSRLHPRRGGACSSSRAGCACGVTFATAG